jgi:hypothetical protein
VSETRKRPIDLLYARIESDGIDALTQPERRLFALYWLYVETNNGGLHQFFFNDSGKFARDALEGLEMFGAAKTADILRRAIALFPQSQVPVDQLERRSVLCGLPDEIQWDRMGKLSDEFYQDKEDVAQLTKSYMAAHPNLFPALQQ